MNLISRAGLSVLLLMLVSFVTSSELNAQGELSPEAESITEAELKDHIYFLASDYMNGRVGPSAEYEIAAQYAASQFAGSGLEPVVSSEGNMNGWFQEVPFQKVVMDETSSWTLSTKKEELSFEHNEDFKVVYGSFFNQTPVEVVYAGYGIVEPDAGWDDLADLDLAGKMVVLMSGTPQQNGAAVLPDTIDEQYTAMRGLQRRLWPLVRQAPAGIILAVDEDFKSELSFTDMESRLSREQYTYKGGEERFRFPMVYAVSDELIAALFKGQASDPAAVFENGVSKKYKPGVLKNVSLSTDYRVKVDEEVMLKNVVAMVEGTDPELKGEYITVGAHLDHVSGSDGQVYNGADDNASGSAGVLEVAEAVAMAPPRRSVVFIAYTAEEMGLNGSSYFVNAGPLAVEDMKFNVNLDMIGRTRPDNEETRAHGVFGNEQYAPLEAFISEINARTVNWPLVYQFGGRMRGSSDHASFNRAGIPAFYFCSGSHEDLHRPTDDPERIEYDKAEAISRLAYMITMELANMDQVPAFTEE